VQSLITVATRIASAAGKTAGATVLEQLRQTLEAALADPAAENAVRSGRLVLALSYSGFGEVDLTDAVLNAMPATDELATARRARAEAAAAAANDRVRAAKAVLAHASRESDRSVAEHVRASAELEDLRGKLEQAQAREEAALDAVNRNRHTHEEAQRELALAEVALAATSVGAGLERGPVQ
jgi:hypothetical protein